MGGMEPYRAHPGLDRPDRAAPGAGPGRVRQPGAYHSGVLRHVDRGDPLVHPLVFLVVDNLRFRLAHRGHLLCLTGGIEAGGPGVPVGGHQARNTDRRARGDSARPSGQDPSARLSNGFASQSCPASRAAAPTVPPREPQRSTNPAVTRQQPQPAQTRPGPDFHAARPSAGCNELSPRLQGRAERAARLAARVVLPTLPRTSIGCESREPGPTGGRDAPAESLTVTGPAAPP